MADTKRKELDKLYSGLQTLPGLIGDLALSVATAQQRLDQSYIESLADFTRMVKEITTAKGKDNNTTTTTPADEFRELFKAIAPSRYQFTETVIEVRADLQMASSSQLELGASVGIKRPVFAATVNVSYLKRTASDYRAAATDSNLMEQLLARGGNAPSATLPENSSFQVLKESFGDLFPDTPALTDGNKPADGDNK
jgi:hypothetical protein